MILNKKEGEIEHMWFKVMGDKHNTRRQRPNLGDKSLHSFYTEGTDKLHRDITLRKMVGNFEVSLWIRYVTFHCQGIETHKFKWIH